MGRSTESAGDDEERWRMGWGGKGGAEEKGGRAEKQEELYKRRGAE